MFGELTLCRMWTLPAAVGCCSVDAVGVEKKGEDRLGRA